MNDVLFDHQLARVTTSAVHVKDGQTYFLAQVSSVRVSRDSNLLQLLFSIAFLLVGGTGALTSLAVVLLTLGDLGMLAVGLVLLALSGALLAVGVLIPILFPALSWLVFTTSAGEVRVVSSADATKIAQIRDAIIRAMAHRG